MICFYIAIVTLFTLLGILIILLIYEHFQGKAILEKIDKMIDSAIDETFIETTYDESRLSKIESKLYRYLSLGQTSLRQIRKEKNMIETLIADISHQTKTPIANILLYLELLSEGNNLSKEQKEIVSQLDNQSQKLSFLISSLVKISRLENGIVTVNPEKHNIKELFKLLDYGKIARKKGIQLEIDQSNDVNAMFDLKWTSEAIGNIVDNAIKYTQSGGKVSVILSNYEMFVRIDVIDTGIGISEEDTAKIFGRFYRSRNVCDEDGVGIGLYLAREIIQKQGGYIKVNSHLGSGSTFSIFLPKR